MRGWTQPPVSFLGFLPANLSGRLSNAKSCSTSRTVKHTTHCFSTHERKTGLFPKIALPCSSPKFRLFACEEGPGSPGVSNFPPRICSLITDAASYLFRGVRRPPKSFRFDPETSLRRGRIFHDFRSSLINFASTDETLSKVERQNAGLRQFFFPHGLHKVPPRTDRNCMASHFPLAHHARPSTQYMRLASSCYSIREWVLRCAFGRGFRSVSSEFCREKNRGPNPLKAFKEGFLQELLCGPFSRTSPPRYGTVTAPSTCERSIPG